MITHNSGYVPEELLGPAIPGVRGDLAQIMTGDDPLHYVRVAQSGLGDGERGCARAALYINEPPVRTPPGKVEQDLSVGADKTRGLVAQDSAKLGLNGDLSRTAARRRDDYGMPADVARADPDDFAVAQTRARLHLEEQAPLAWNAAQESGELGFQEVTIPHFVNKNAHWKV